MINIEKNALDSNCCSLFSYCDDFNFLTVCVETD